MGEKFRRWKVTGMVKFDIDDIFEDNLKDLRKRLHDPNIFIKDDIMCSLDSRRAEIIFSKMEDQGICDMDEFYAQRDKTPETTPASTDPGAL